MTLWPIVDATGRTGELAQARDVLNDASTANDVAPRFTCTEIEALATILRGVRAADIAALWIAAHAATDDEGDMHFDINN